MSLKGMKLKKKILLTNQEEKINRNNYPCKDFHLNIFQKDNDPTRVYFIYLTPEKYTSTASQLKSEEDVKSFFDILKKEQKEISCDLSLFTFKTIYSNLNETELNFLRESRKKSPIKIKNDEKYFKFLDKYLKLKSEKEKKYKKNKKQVIKNDTLTLEEKREKIKKHKNKCLGCKRNVGNIFFNKDGKLGITCGDKEQPCKLNVSANKPKFISISKKIEDILQLLEITKQEIIKIKLDLLFQLKPEEIVTEQFETFKKKYNDLNAELISYKLLLEQNQRNEARYLKNEIEKVKLYEYIKIFKQNIKEYEITNTKTFLTEEINTYIKDILPIQENIRNILYKIIFIDKIIIGGGPMSKPIIKYKLIQKKNTIESQQFKIIKS